MSAGASPAMILEKIVDMKKLPELQLSIRYTARRINRRRG
jgi:hypothetical protein